MRLRRLELAVIALTLAFACFMGGYFTGRRGSVNIVTVASRYGEPQTVRTEAAFDAESVVSIAETSAPASSPLPAGISAADANGDAGAGAVPADAIGLPRDSDGRININTASRSELTDLPGIGDVLAGRIVDYRQQNGLFLRIEDIRNVSGIGEKRFEAIRERITIG